ncbi:MAG TPA: GDSL-type esterase/lipase family protein, partial [Chitinophagaceae bacterium]|nr:GDSL-type esterase/lipase family protein [Chitinophagaceae bacterium]
MKKITVVMVAMFAISCFGFTPQKKTKVIFFGDSITELGVQTRNDSGKGYVLKIDSLCKAEGKSALYDFVGAGVSGNKVYDLYLRLEDDVLSKNPDVVVIYIGVNDVWHKATSGTGTDPDKFERFYNAIIKKLKEKNIRVILCTPAVIGEKNDNTNQQDGDLNQYSNVIRNIAQKNNLTLVDLRKMFVDYSKLHNPENKDRNILTRDRVHLNEKGNQTVAEKV